MKDEIRDLLDKLTVRELYDLAAECEIQIILRTGRNYDDWNKIINTVWTQIDWAEKHMGPNWYVYLPPNLPSITQELIKEFPLDIRPHLRYMVY